MPRTTRQKRNKMLILADQLRKYGKSTNLQCVVFTEGAEEGTVMLTGYYGNVIVSSLIQQLCLMNRTVVDKAIAELDDLSKEIETAKKPQADGQEGAEEGSDTVAE